MKRQRWREKARAYRDFGMAVADQDLRHALFAVAEVYSREAERVAGCGRVADPSPFAASTVETEPTVLRAAGARRIAEAVQKYLIEADADQGQVAAPLPGSGPSEAEQGAGMDAGYVRQQAAKYHRRASEIGDPVASLALLSLALTCERLARDIEASEARRCRVFQSRTGH